MRTATFTILFVFLSLCSLGQSQLSEDEILDSIAQKVFVEESLDIENIHEFENKKYKKAVEVFSSILNGNYNYADLAFCRKTYGFKVQSDSSFFNTFKKWTLSLPLPEKEDQVIHFYENMVFIISAVRNAGNLVLADDLNNDFLEKINQLNVDEDLRKKGEIYASIHKNVIHLIRREFEEGYKASNLAYQQAQATNDTNLIIATAYYLSDFLVGDPNNLQAYIDLVDKAYKLDSMRTNKSVFFISIMNNYLNALIFQQKQPDKIEKLLDELQSYAGGYYTSLELLLFHVSKLDSNSIAFNKILDKYNCNSLPGLIQKLDSQAVKKLKPNDYIFFLKFATTALANHNHLQAAIANERKVTLATEKLYSERLSKQLAEIEKVKVEKAKDLEIAKEKQAKQYYSIIALIVGLLVLISVSALILQIKQGKKLQLKNAEIESQKNLLQKADSEKGLLIKEIHHRVKNNFQVVSSLLELQSRGIEDVKAKELAEEGQNRVKSMSLIHQRLYQNDDLLISFDEYTKALVNEISAMYDKEVETDIKTNNFSFDIDTAIPLGLILNELITNSFKYGLDQTHNKISIHFEKLESEYKMVVKDNGKGIDHNLDLKRTKSLGLKLVHRLSQQLKGKAEILKEEGAAFAIYFKDTEMRKLMN